MTMKMYLRPFLKIDVVAASGATVTFLYFSVTLTEASVTGDEYGPMMASTLSSVMSFSYVPVSDSEAPMRMGPWAVAGTTPPTASASATASAAGAFEVMESLLRGKCARVNTIRSFELSRRGRSLGARDTVDS